MKLNMPFYLSLMCALIYSFNRLCFSCCITVISHLLLSDSSVFQKNIYICGGRLKMKQNEYSPLKSLFVTFMKVFSGVLKRCGKRDKETRREI